MLRIAIAVVVMLVLALDAFANEYESKAEEIAAEMLNNHKARRRANRHETWARENAAQLLKEDRARRIAYSMQRVPNKTPWIVTKPVPSAPTKTYYYDPYLGGYVEGSCHQSSYSYGPSYGYSYNQPSYSYNQPSYSYSQPSYGYTYSYQPNYSGGFRSGGFRSRSGGSCGPGG